MVAIDHMTPVQVGLKRILASYLEHEEDVVTKRTKFDLDKAEARLEIIQGLIHAMDILDQVIKTIRASKNKADAKKNLIAKYKFTEKQAEAIVMLQLYKLTNTDVTELLERKDNLKLMIEFLENILNDENKLKNVMKDELRSIKKEYATPRKTTIEDEVSEIKIDTISMIQKEDCIVVITHQGYVKRVSLRSYNANEEETLVKENDYVIGLYEMNTLDTLLLFTDLGNYLYIPVYEIPDLKWKELGKHISNIIKINSDENIIKSIPVYDFNKDSYITLFSKDGIVKRTKLNEFKVTRYSKPMSCMKLKDNDKIVSVTDSTGSEVFIATKNGYGLRYKTSEISIVGIKASGVKAINLKDDEVVSGILFNITDYVTIITANGTGKRVKINEFELSTRARRGVLLVRDVKTNPYHILKTFINVKKIGILTNDISYMKVTELPIVDRYSTGTVINKKGIIDCFEEVNLTKKEEPNIIEEEIIDISLDDIDEKILTIDDFLDDFKI